LSSFSELGVLPATVEALTEKGITTPFPIQEQTIPLGLAGTDVIGQAKTGTGKTLAFGVPILQRITAPSDPEHDELGDATGKPQALVVCPTRELAMQVAEDIAEAGAKRFVRVTTVYGGRAYEPQIKALTDGVDVVVGTPGRLLDLCAQGHLDLSHARVLVLDEADEMLDLGFLPDVEKLISQTPVTRQTLLFSATMPPQVLSLARHYLTKPVHIRAHDPADYGATVKTTEQHAFRAHALDKVEMLARILQAEGRGLTMVFCRTKRTCDKVAQELEDRGFAAAAVHGDLGQGSRERALRAFRSGKIDVLVATDVAARGLDVDDVTHVINYQCPDDDATYVHRIGRTGRAGKSGTAVTFIDWDEVPKWNLINKALELELADPPEMYSSSPELYAALRIPEGAKGKLPRDRRVREGLSAETLEDVGETGKKTGKSADSRKSGASARSRKKGEHRHHESGHGSGPNRSRQRSSHRGEEAAGTSGATGGEPKPEGAQPRRRRRRRRSGGGQAEAQAD
jgi:superfamily II DNA/RNA helicase